MSLLGLLFRWILTPYDQTIMELCRRLSVTPAMTAALLRKRKTNKKTSTAFLKKTKGKLLKGDFNIAVICEAEI